MRTRGVPARDARVFRALAHPTRRRILHLLGAGEARAGDVARAFPQARPTIAKHLRVLREAGLVTVRAHGRERLYAIAPGPLRDAAAQVNALDALLQDGLDPLGARLAEQARDEP